MKKILFVINSLNCGGAERVLINLVNGLAKKGYDITLLTIFSGNELSNDLNENVKYQQAIKIKNKYYQAILYKIFSRIVSEKILYRLLIKNDFDIEIAALEGLPTKLIAGSTNAKSKKYAWVHINLEQYCESDYCFKNLNVQKALYKNFNKIICVSEGVKQSFIKKFGIENNVKVVINPINEVSIKNKSVIDNQEYYMKKKGMRFVSVGRLVNQKGFERLIEAAKRLKKDGYCFNISIVGEGDQRPHLELLIEKYNLTEDIQLLGFQSNPYKYMQGADAFVLSSYVEGYVSTVVEALIIGLPVIATDCTGVSEIIGNGEYGLLIENNTNGIYEGMKKVLDNTELLEYYRKKSHIRANYYNIEERIKEIEGLLNE